MTMSIQAESEKGLVVAVDDIFFAAKISGTADAVGTKITRVKSANELIEELEKNGACLILLDLNSSKLDPIVTIQYLKSKADLKAIPIVGFVSHVQADLMNTAQQAGCDYVMPRSAFSKRLPDLLSLRLDL
jgi:CheY-like chemotaxis protein